MVEAEVNPLAVIVRQGNRLLPRIVSPREHTQKTAPQLALPMADPSARYAVIRRPRTPTTVMTDPSGEAASPPGWRGDGTIRTTELERTMWIVLASSSPTNSVPAATGMAS